MKLGWGAGQILALLLFGVVLIVTSVLLELTSVVRLEVDGARNESGVITQALLGQINEIVQTNEADPAAAIAGDERLALVLQAATEQAPSVVYVAIGDSNGVAIAHTTSELVGRPIRPGIVLPEAGGFRETTRLLLTTLSRSARSYEVVTPLMRGDVPFGSIRVGVAGELVRDRANAVFRRSLRVAAIEIAMGLAVGFVMASMTRRRLAEIGAGVAALRAGRFGEQIPESGIDEFSRLARDLNLLSRQFQEERNSQMGTFQRAVDLLGDGLLAVSPEREVVLLNGVAARLLGVSVADARGKRIQELLPEAHAVRRLTERVLEGGEPNLSIDLPETPSGTRYAAVGHRVVGPDSPGGVLIEFREKAALQEIHTLVDHSRVLSRLGEMAAGVAHEIRNSLQTMHFELGHLRESARHGSRDIEDHVRAALSEVQRLENAVNGFLKVARLRQIQPTPLRPNELLGEIGEVLDVEARLGGLELVLDLADSPPVIQGDREVLRQAIQNLVRNAIQAQPSRDRRIILGSRSTGGVLRISVSDSGPGIPPEIIDRVTDLYFTTRDKGSGVGLAVARQAIEMHGGELEIESQPGEGTTVSLRFSARAELGRAALQEV